MERNFRLQSTVAPGLLFFSSLNTYSDMMSNKFFLPFCLCVSVKQLKLSSLLEMYKAMESCPRNCKIRRVKISMCNGICQIHTHDLDRYVSFPTHSDNCRTALTTVKGY